VEHIFHGLSLNAGYTAFELSAVMPVTERGAFIHKFSAPLLRLRAPVIRNTTARRIRKQRAREASGCPTNMSPLTQILG